MIKKTFGSFNRGLIISTASDKIPQGALLRAENVDLSKEGCVRPRKGHTAINGSVLDQTVLHSHFKATKRYTGAGTKLYRDFTSILTGLTSGNRFQFAAMQPYTDLLEWVFMANGDAAGMKKDDGTNLRTWGIAAPGAALTSAAGAVGSLQGTYTYKITFVNGATGFESNASPASTSLTLTGELEAPLTASTAAIGAAGLITPGTYTWKVTFRASGTGIESDGGPVSNSISNGVARQINLTAIPTSTNPDVDSRRIYRTGGGNTDYKLVTTINDNVTTIYTDNIANGSLGAVITASHGRKVSLSAIPVSADAQVTKRKIYRLGGTVSSYLLVTTINDNTTTTYTDDIADSSLGIALVELNDPPPVCNKLVADGRGYLFLTGNASYPQRVYWCRANQPEAWPSTNYVEVGSAFDPPQVMASFGYSVYVFTKKAIYQMMGPIDGVFNAVRTNSHVGTLAPYAVIVTPLGVFFVGNDFQVYLFNGSVSEPVSERSDGFDVAPFFRGENINSNGSLNTASVAECFATFHDNKYWLSYPDGASTVCNKMIVYDALRQRAWKDSRAFRVLTTELNDLLVGGAADGFLYRLENGNSDNGANITMTVELREEILADEHRLAGLRRYRVDMDTLGGSVTLAFDLDGTEVLTGALNVTRSNAQVRRNFAPKKRGHRLKTKITYTGQLQPEFYAVEVEFEPLEAK